MCISNIFTILIRFFWLNAEDLYASTADNRCIQHSYYSPVSKYDRLPQKKNGKLLMIWLYEYNKIE